MEDETKNEHAPALDLRHIGRVYDKEMPVEQAGMEMSKPGLPDLRRRRHSVTLPEAELSQETEYPSQTDR